MANSEAVAEDTVQICPGLSKPNKCAFCGCKENLRIHTTVACRWNENVFCQDTDCSDKYDSYVYSNGMNLTNGVPFCYTSGEYGYKIQKQKIKKSKKEDKHVNLICAYCGVENEDVIWDAEWPCHIDDHFG